MAGILWIVLVVLLIGWVLGLVFRVAGNFVHVLLVIALIVLVYNLITGRNAA